MDRWLRVRRDLTALVWVAGILFCALPVFPGGSTASAGTVYCPLQRKWVARSQPKPAVDLSRICAGQGEKDRFAEASARALAGPDVTESDFFEFVRTGVVRPSSPEAPRSVTIRHNTAAAPSGDDRQREDARTTTAAFSPQLPKPLSRGGTASFASSLPPYISRALRHISPRGPPVFIL